MADWTSEESDRLVALVAEHGTTWRRIGKLLKRPDYSCARQWKRSLAGQTTSEYKAANGRERKRGLTAREFIEQHDAATKTRLAIRRLLKQLRGNEILKDADMRSECGAPSNGWRQIAEEQEFLPYQFAHEGRYWWASPKTITEVCATVGKARRLDE